jgi:heat shock protein 90kDa beta
MFARIASDDSVAFEKVSKIYGNALRIGVIETKDKKDRNKLADLLRFESTLSNYTSLDEVSIHQNAL